MTLIQSFPPSTAQEIASGSPMPSGRPRPGEIECELLAAALDRHVSAAACHDLASRLLDRFGSLAAVLAAGDGELSRLCGLTPSVIEDFKLFRNVAVALAREEARKRPVIASWTALLAYARAALAEAPREQFRVLYLDRKNQLLRDEWIAEGTVDHAPVFPREVIRRALEVSASAMILVHNHPSGDPAPSQADIAMTRQIVDAARVLGLQVHDHLIVGRAGTASFKSLGLI